MVHGSTSLLLTEKSKDGYLDPGVPSFFFFFFSFGDHLSAFSASLYLLFFFFRDVVAAFSIFFFNRHLFPQCSPILPALGVPMQDAGEKKKKCINRAVRDNDALCVFFFFSPSVLTPFHLARRCFLTFLSQSFVYAFVIVIVVFWGMKPRSIPLSNNKQYWQCLCF